MEYAVCAVAAAPVRKEPNHRSEMVNQLLFGETMQVLETRNEWIKIRSLYDNYDGWLTCHLVASVDEKVAAKDLCFVATDLLNQVKAGSGVINIPIGSSLTGFNKETGSLWDQNYIFRGMYRDINDPFDNDRLLDISYLWLNSPYLWGGKTFMGIDCSGFVQTVFKIAGIKLQRDAYLQADQGAVVDQVATAKKGDVAFFANENGRVIHVGILLDSQQIIHASGKVRIDKIDERGIINNETGKRTHFLHSIKRMI